MNGGPPLDGAGSVALTVIFVVLFIFSRDLVQKQLAMFTASYFVFVVYSKVVFGLDFSSKTHIGSFGIDFVSLSLIVFWISFFFASNLKLVWKNEAREPLRLPGGHKTTINTLILTLPIFAFFVYYMARNGIRFTGAFVDYRGERSTLTDYVFVYYVALLAYYRNSRLVLALGVIAATSHLLSAERLRSFVYIIAVLVNFYRLDTRRHISSFLFLMGFFVATVIGQLRTGSLTANQDYNITHFGSVTVSSLYLLDFGSTINASQRLLFSFGTLLANLVPSSLVPEAYNIRRAILSYAVIPGGGWLPIFLSVQTGLFGVIAVGIFLGKGYQKLLSRTRFQSDFQPAFYAATIAFISTTPRWFMYTPFQLLKMPLYAFVLTATLITLGKITNIRRTTRGT